MSIENKVFEDVNKERIAEHRRELSEYLPKLEGRLVRGLDPAGMLAVGEEYY